MAQNHYGGMDSGVQPWLRQGHERRISHDHHRQAKDGFDAKHGIKSSPSISEMNSPVMFEGETRWRGRGRGRSKSNWAASGPGMQAVFLGTRRKSCGTGVFIPRGHDIDFQFSNKPAFSPVLLPAKVIQALNLDVHQLGCHIKPQSEKDKNDVEIKKKENLEKEDDVSFSPEIFLPKDWTY